jgi:hypothetical protein
MKWCKGCKEAFPWTKKGDVCNKGHPNFMYVKKKPGSSSGGAKGASARPGSGDSAAPPTERERLEGLAPFKLRAELKAAGLEQGGTEAEMIERILSAPPPEEQPSEVLSEAQEVAGAKGGKQHAAAEASKQRRAGKAAEKAEAARIARVRMSSEEKAAAGAPETIDERVERQKLEKYEASDEFKLEQQKKSEEQANISLSASSQLSEQDISKEKDALSAESEAKVKRWIEDVTGVTLDGDLKTTLKSGVVLCELVNKIKPGAVEKVSTSSMPFGQRENVTLFIAAARSLGVLDRENFDTNDLFEGGNMKQVLIALGGMLTKQAVSLLVVYVSIF